MPVELASYNSNGLNENQRGILGAGGAMDWRQMLYIRNFGWHVTVGTFSTPITGGGNGTVVDLDQPECVISVPTNRVLIPVRFAIQIQPSLIDTDSEEEEIIITVDKDVAIASGDGTATTETPINLGDSGVTGCPVSVFSAYTADVTDPTHDYDLARYVAVHDVQGVAATALRSSGQLLYEPKTSPIIRGPASVCIYWGGTNATTGFAELEFIAMTAAQFGSYS